jgi:hypothetical protein
VRSGNPWETRVAHIAPEHLGVWPFRAEAVPFSIAMPTATWVTHVVLETRPLLPQQA